MEEAGDEPLFCERAAGIDIGKRLLSVTIRVPSDSRRGGRQQETREFGATRRELLELADWLRCWGVERAGMEATGDYWKPVFFLLEREGFACLLYQASQVKALPGRPKTDRLDSAWLARVTERGVLAGSFVPPEEIRRLRAHTRYRRRLIQARAAEKVRCEKLLEDAHLKLSSVISDIHGVSGRDMLAAVIAGERDPEVLAQKARAAMRRKIPQLREALDCSFFTPDHGFVLQMMLDNIDHFTAQVERLNVKIAALCEPYERQVAQLDAIPGFGVTTAQDLIGEIGIDMTVFPTAGHLCSWARLAPRVRESGGRRKGGSATGRGNPYVGGTLGDAAAAAGRSRTFLGAKYRHLCPRMPKKKALGAIMRAQLAIAHGLLSDPAAEFRDLGPDYYAKRAAARGQARGHVRSLQRLGYKVTIEPITSPGPDATAMITRPAS
jgi:transposase